jgi:nitroimidazol reductase NimA-like FMN-containing flavoprotein (pyridoxamine 5'-phosphate oxidase superfamily)
MHQIRYQKRICTDQEKIEALLHRARTGVVGMVEAGMPYTVPVNFVWYNGAVYFHGMGSGRKENILREAPPVCFTVYEENGTVTDPVPCKADTAYLSIMIFGTAVKVTDFTEAADALQQILDKYTPGYYTQTLSGSLIEKYRSAHDNNAVAVYRIEPQEMTVKENAVAEV